MIRIANSQPLILENFMKIIDRDVLKKTLVSASVAALTAFTVLGPVQTASAGEPVSFEMVRSPGLNAFPNCLPKVHAHVTIIPNGAVETMFVKAEGLPPSTDFDLFVIQVPNAPFGMSWYQGDFETNTAGAGVQVYAGRFNLETFIVAPNVAPAPVVHTQPNPDASSNPKTAPIHTYHLGLWFNSPADAEKAGCPTTMTPFNGDHTAGVQVLNTSNFADLQGPLLQVQ
jgi:hypothetical protein